ncbi:MAG TPA: uroporphyrinogen-III C-methyltransferase [Candidatus Dormibacteraeota bacterium]|nr:uroporphyrinogen-III C-methyltransferase [Candidatus Dormibacteraeota bacterium]
MKRGKVSLVGAGPGDPGLLTVKAARLIAHADVLVYDYLAAEPIVALAPPTCERIYVGKKAGRHIMTQEEIDALLVRLGREGKRVVRLKGGDPFVFGRGGEEAEELAAAGVPFEIVPGITSAIAAPAYAGIPVTHRDHNPQFVVCTGHEDPAKPASTIDWAKLADPHRTIVLLMAMGNLREIAARLIAEGLAPATPVAVVREGTKPDQRTVTGTLATIADDVERERLEAPAVVVIGSVVELRGRLRWFDSGALAGRGVLVTRPPEDAREMTERLYELGARPIAAPLIAIEPPRDVEAARMAARSVGSYAWVVFTSRNGVRACFGHLDALGLDARAFGGAKIAAIGPATAQELASHGLRADFVPETYVAELVAEGLLERTGTGDRILLYRAAEARDVLPERLRGAGRACDVVAAYRTVARRDAELREKVGRAHVLTFASSSTVRAFVEALDGDLSPADGKVVACIGPVTARTARELGLRVDVVADVYTADGLIDALEATALAGS